MCYAPAGQEPLQLTYAHPIRGHCRGTALRWPLADSEVSRHRHANTVRGAPLSATVAWEWLSAYIAGDRRARARELEPTFGPRRACTVVPESDGT